MKNEDIDKRIERVIGSVASKKADMDRWERQLQRTSQMAAAGKRRRSGIIISAAASVAVICGIGISVFLNRPSDAGVGLEVGVSPAPVYRGSSSDLNEIAAMINSAKYDEALRAIDNAMADTVIDPSFTPERREYLHTLIASRLDDLTWMKINVLVRTGKKDEAIELLKSYTRYDGEHRQEARELLNHLSR